MEKVKILTGHSGCEVILYAEEKKYFIRKKSTSIEYNSRLQIQIQKQIDVFKLEQSYFKVPQILNTGFEDNLYFADMEFVKGTTLINYLLNTDYKKIINLVDNILNIIEFFSKIEILDDSNHFENILVKTNETLDKINIGIKSKNNLFSSLIRKLKEFKELKSTFCHGDFTLENIMIDSNGNLYLIDFLDNFSQHYYFDIVKIYQDIEGEWYKIKNDQIEIPKIKLLFFKEIFDEKINKKFKYYKHVHYYLLALTFLRILPYTKDKAQYFKIKNRVDKYLNLAN